MGRQAFELFRTFDFPPRDEKKYDSVLKKFEDHFIMNVNEVAESHKFMSRFQQHGEMIADFIQDLHKLALNCNFGALKDRLIRDRIVSGVLDTKLRGKLLLEKALTKDRAVELPKNHDGTGKAEVHKKETYPAKDSDCRKCRKKGHFAKVCRSSQQPGPSQPSASFIDTAFLNVTVSEPAIRWEQEILVAGKSVKFLLDSGADVTCVPFAVYLSDLKERFPKLPRSDCLIKAANHTELVTRGMLTTTLECNGQSLRTPVYVVEGLGRPLLSLENCIALNLIKRVNQAKSSPQVTTVEPEKEFPGIFDGLGELDDLIAADTLSRAPLPYATEMETEVEAYVNLIHENLPASDSKISEIIEMQCRDPETSRIRYYVETGWPERKGMSIPFYQVRSELHLRKGLLLRNSRIVIPAHIEDMVKKCQVCIQHSVQRHEPLIPSEFPTHAWETVAMDLLYLRGKWYLLIADYYSRYPEFTQLESLTSKSVILKCKEIFTRHGFPTIVRSDNGPQFEPMSTSDFQIFVRNWGFRHITSSPKFPQSNGLIEKMVNVIELAMKKNSDPHLALLIYRSAPLENGYTPFELLMNRLLRTTIPTFPDQFQPKIVDLTGLKGKEEMMREKKKQNYDAHHGVRQKAEFQPGACVADR
ncbi:unnamed protein product [Allacma fusca]|uniref:Integrase catalytic domain-containing protein n=1 Tax=Allacma fusca TaxID=39272 RepID=A0A8J2JP21_9HEXA|nr:unnamed protein product [Allacma fusca]